MAVQNFMVAGTVSFWKLMGEEKQATFSLMARFEFEGLRRKCTTEFRLWTINRLFVREVSGETDRRLTWVTSMSHVVVRLDGFDVCVLVLPPAPRWRALEDRNKRVVLQYSAVQYSTRIRNPTKPWKLQFCWHSCCWILRRCRLLHLAFREAPSLINHNLLLAYFHSGMTRMMKLCLKQLRSIMPMLQWRMQTIKRG